jgi:hypothetical protein
MTAASQTLLFCLGATSVGFSLMPGGNAPDEVGVCQGAIGRRTVKIVPTPFVLLIVIVPPWSRTVP